MTAPFPIHVDPELPDRETRRHRGRLVVIAANPDLADLAARIEADPDLAAQLAPQTVIQPGLYQSALDSREWLRQRGIPETERQSS